MKILLRLLTLLILISPNPASAWSLNQSRDNTGVFLLGLAGGYLAHEAGHILIAKSKGYRVELDGPTLTYPGAQLSDAERLQISSAGFQAQWLATEAAFFYRNKKRMTAAGDNFSAGVICSQLLISAAYLTVLNDHPDGDLHGISEATDLTTIQLAALIAIPAVLDAWRLFGRDVPKWVPLLSVSSKGAGLAAVWTF